MGEQDWAARAAELDGSDPLRTYRDLFLIAPDDDVIAYLDGNSLGRPLRSSADRIAAFVQHAWAGRLIRGWDEDWLDLPLRIGDSLGTTVLGAGPGQTTIGDSTTVLLYKLVRGAVELRPGRAEIVIDTDNFPTDRYVVEGIATELGLDVVWVQTDQRSGIEPDLLAPALNERTALVVLSHVAYRSGQLADVAAITRQVHDVGGLVLWDLCHSVGSVPIDLDAWGVDLAVGCTYKYLNGGPGSPAFGYVRRDHLPTFRQPIWGWMGRKDAFEMGPGFEPTEGVRRLLSGTPPIVGMLAVQDTLELIAQVGMPALRAKSTLLTEFAAAVSRDRLEPLGVELASPSDPSRRGGHLTVEHPLFRELTPRLWDAGVIPDFRAPRGLRLGLSPLSTCFGEVLAGLTVIRSELAQLVAVRSSSA